MTPSQIGRPRFVSIDEAIAWHEVVIEQFGGASGVREIGLLESALAAARQGFGDDYVHDYPFEMAAAYAFYIAKNHPFVDGNKRTALLCAGGFLRMNGWNLGSDGTSSADAILDLVEGRMNKDSYAEWLQANSRPRASMELRDFFAAIEIESLLEYTSSILADEATLPTQFTASVQEATESMPVLAKMHEGLLMARQAKDVQQLQRCFAQSLVFVALFRLAQDMGYEW